MKTAPVIIVQLIHIEGPLKGQIVELSDPEIKIGRHPSCQLKYPADLSIISREHAKITREGNRFKLTDHSSNGTIVNGKRIKEIFLKDGDVITVSEGGPKVSFLTQMTDTPLAPPEPEPQAPPPRQDVTPPPVVEEPQIPVSQPVPQPTPQPVPQPAPQPVSQPVAQPVPQAAPVSAEPVIAPAAPVNKVPLIIQYGPTLRSFEELPLKIGSHTSCDFLLEHAQIVDLHAEIFFADGHYQIRDLTGQQMITMNNIPVGQGAILEKDGEIALSSSGPFFQFLGNGRLAEVEKKYESRQADSLEPRDDSAGKTNDEKGLHKPMSFIKKIFSKG